MTVTPSSPPTSSPGGHRQLDAAEAEALGMMVMGGRPPLSRYVRELWGRREFIWLIPRSELRSRSMTTFLGGAWHLLNPLFLAAVYYVIFSVVFKRSTEEIPNYPGFLIIGIMTFYFTQKTVLQGARAVVNDVKLLQNVNFPAAVLPISAAISEFLSQGYALVAMLILVVATGESPHLTWLLLVPLVGMQLLFNMGLSFVTARMTVHFRDVEQFLPYLMRIWLYFSGVLFSESFLPAGPLRTLFRLNPPYAFIRLARDAVLDGTFDPTYGLLALGWTVLAFTVGFLYFWQHEGQYANAA